MKKNIFKIIISFLIILIIGLLISRNSFAWDFNTVLQNIEDSAVNNNSTSTTKVTNIMGGIISIVSTIGASIAVITLIIIGIKYVSSGVEGKADAKKDLFSYTVGAVILFGISGILKLLQMFIDKNLNDI